ncbi:MAG: carotenoid oxygenase family protein [Nannocystaceae bacterium]|nr:carotenoid oxygenase family protein [Nannocystaceae bacterium]
MNKPSSEPATRLAASNSGSSPTTADRSSRCRARYRYPLRHTDGQRKVSIPEAPDLATPLDPGQLSSESVFAPNPEGRPETGWLLTLVFDSFTRQSHVLVHDAQTLSQLARVQLKQAIPLTFHGGWVAG